MGVAMMVVVMMMMITTMMMMMMMKLHAPPKKGLGPSAGTISTMNVLSCKLSDVLGVISASHFPIEDRIGILAS